MICDPIFVLEVKAMISKITYQLNEKLKWLTQHRVLICFCGILLVYNYFFNSETLIVSVKEPKFSLLRPQDNGTVLKLDDKYDQLIDIKDFTFKINPKPCKNYPAGLLLVIIVNSNPIHHENRLTIRNTWGKVDDSTKLVFCVGETTNVTLGRQLQLESIMFGDIVQGNFIDSYRNMTYKHVMALKWVAHHCSTAKYILKTDDDVFVNLYALRQFLARELSPWGAKGLIACPVAKHGLVERSKRSKWMVSTDEYAFQYYPPYCKGWVILYSQDVISRLLKVAQNIPYFWIDDVHITGTVAQKIGVARTHLSNLFLNSRRAALLRMLGPDYVGQFLFGPPDLSVKKIIQLWEATSS